MTNQNRTDQSADRDSVRSSHAADGRAAHGVANAEGTPGMLDTDMMQPERQDYPMSGDTTSHQTDATADNHDTTTSALDDEDEMDDDPEQAADAVSPTGGLPISREWMRDVKDPGDSDNIDTADDLIDADDMDKSAGNARIRTTRKSDGISDFGEADPEVARALAGDDHSGDR